MRSTRDSLLVANYRDQEGLASSELPRSWDEGPQYISLGKIGVVQHELRTRGSCCREDIFSINRQVALCQPVQFLPENCIDRQGSET